MMTRKLCVVACCVVLAASTLFAQARTAKGDPLSGTWTGEIVPPNAPGPLPITIELKFDGKSAVTGTLTGLPSPGDVKIGTFDAKTGALKLQMGKTDEEPVLLVFEGTLASGAVAGHVTGPEGTGEFKIAKKK
jgi:hypothetical protein